jgi:hypothetical protein
VDTVPIGMRCDWWRVIQDLSTRRLSVAAIALAAGILKSTLMGYKNQAVEPKQADGVRLLQLWRDRMLPALPMVEGNTRVRRVRGRGGW